MTEVTPEQRFRQAYPELAGPGSDTESGRVLYGQPGHPRVGAIPHLLPPELRDKENAERERQWAALSDAEKAAIEHMRELATDQMRRGARPF